MAPPRYLFTARVLARTVGEDPRIAWRLVGGNNHEIGRSADSFADLDTCLASVRVLKERIGQAEPEPTNTGNQWGWVLRLDGREVAVSCRWYRRSRESQYNLLQFLAVAPTAELSEVVGSPPPRRELLRPDYVLPHHVPAALDDLAPDGLDGRDALEGPGAGDGPERAHEDDDVDARTQDLPRDTVDELTEAS